MAKKPHTTKTTGPIHFEDLDPKRFEGLIRQLIYDFRDWRTIEATGEGGSDDGFDVRAYEKTQEPDQVEIEDDTEFEIRHPMEGNVWMIQGKREKAIGPSKVKEILKDVDPKNPPYGYILAASTNFSKESFDVFRNELREKGVMEFYLWGKPELEDMLYLPKNDRILFTFFGLSFVSKRKSRATEVRSLITVKNKIFSALGEHTDQFNGSILVRDLKDHNYPYEGEYPDFKKNPRWREYPVFRYHPRGLRVHIRRWYAYVDRERKEWDFTREVDTVDRSKEFDEDREKRFEGEKKVKQIWHFFPRSKQGFLKVDGLISYEDIIVVDSKGDMYYRMPHVFVDYQGEDGPFSGGTDTLEVGNERVELTKDWKRVDVFPKKFTKLPLGKRHKKAIILDPASAESFKTYQDEPIALYDIDNRYSYLNERDIVPIAGSGYDETDQDRLIQITSRFRIKVKDYMQSVNHRPFYIRRDIAQQIGNEPEEEDTINVLEFIRYYKNL